MADFNGELGSERDRALREVDASDASSESRPGQRVHSEMALKMKEALVSDVADRLEFFGSKADPASAEPVEVVELGNLMDGCPLVPKSAIGGDCVVHRPTVVE